LLSVVVVAAERTWELAVAVAVLLTKRVNS